MHHRITATALTAAAVAAAGLMLATGVAADAATTPAKASKPVHAKATTIHLKAAKSTVHPKQKTSLTASLLSAGKPVAGEDLLLEKRDATSHKFGNPVDIGATDADGKVTVPVTPGNRKGTKEQYRVVFLGDAAHKASHSAVITVTVVATSS